MVIQIGESAAEMTMLHKSIRYTKTVYRRPDGLLVVLSDAILLYDREFNLTKSTIGHIDAIGGYTNKPISPDGQLLAIETATRFYVWDIGQNELVTVLTDLGIYHVPFTELGSYVRALAVWSPDSERLAISNQINHQVSVWNAASRSIQNTIDAGSFICTMAWVDDSTLALTLREDSTPVYENQCVSQHLVTLNIETEQINYSDQQFPFILNTIGLYDRRHIAFRTWTDYYTEEEVTSMLMIWDSQTDQITCTMEIDESFRVYRLQSAPGIIIAETGQLRVIDLETGKESIVKLNTDKPPTTPYKFSGSNGLCGF